MRDLGLNVIGIPASQWRQNPQGVLETIHHACAEHTLPDQPDKQWLYADNLEVGDVVYVGADMRPAAMAEILREETNEDVYDIEVEGAHSYVTEVCAVHNCGSRTTAAVAEKLGRRWIACDLGRFAIHTTRKRLLSIDNVRPFDVQNLGKYERQAWQAAEFGAEAAARMLAYRGFILDLYHAEPLTGYSWLHGVRRGRMVHVGSVDAPISTADVSSIVMEFKRAMGAGKDAPTTNGIDILGWDFAFELNEVAKQQAALAKVDVRMLRIPRDVMDKRAVEQGDI